MCAVSPSVDISFLFFQCVCFYTVSSVCSLCCTPCSRFVGCQLVLCRQTHIYIGDLAASGNTDRHAHTNRQMNTHEPTSWMSTNTNTQTQTDRWICTSQTLLEKHTKTDVPTANTHICKKQLPPISSCSTRGVPIAILDCWEIKPGPVVQLNCAVQCPLVGPVTSWGKDIMFDKLWCHPTPRIALSVHSIIGWLVTFLLHLMRT